MFTYCKDSVKAIRIEWTVLAQQYQRKALHWVIIEMVQEAREQRLGFSYHLRNFNKSLL